MTTANNNIDTLENVTTLVQTVKGLIKKTIGLVRLGWINFLAECEAFISVNSSPAFSVGSTYEFGWIGDSELKSTITVIKRTKCFVTFNYGGSTVRAKINLYNGVEYVYPSGQYSMCPTCKASKRVS